MAVNYLSLTCEKTFQLVQSLNLCIYFSGVDLNKRDT